jgi:hypothetical protein
MKNLSRRTVVLCGVSGAGRFASQASAQEATETTTFPLLAVVADPDEIDGNGIVVVARIGCSVSSANSPIVTVGQQYLNRQAGGAHPRCEASTSLTHMLDPESVALRWYWDEEPLKAFGGLPGNTESGRYNPLGRRYYMRP